MNYSFAKKQHIINEYSTGGNATFISRKHNISKSTLYRWLEEFKLKTPVDFNISKSDLKSKLKKLEKLENEIKVYEDIIKLIRLTTQQKLKYARKLDSEYSVHSLCSILQLSRGTYYNDKFRKVEVTLVERDDNKFKPIIKKIFHETKGRLGSPKIRRLKMNEGYKIDEKRVKRLMNELDLHPNRPDDNYKNYHKRRYSQKPSILSKS
ncbi:hypothetical protein CI105_04630 [Candidatus Izimaplasma bacterium ZiA1]|uniref:transposase n=1 Tax=Candidatus Izimoplasma sp. ZiA1 TaxID=2024899 RepID=UPI000BAA5A3F|nr:hypothetical protein CI105_04630 [Candidatus Izimaplasma bacterium ZiA1]